MYSDNHKVFFKKKPKAPKAQPVVVPAPVPVQDVPVTDTAAKKAEMARRQRGGVASTVMSDSLGG